MFTSLVCRWYTNQEICTVDSSQVFSLFKNYFIRKGMVMSGINYIKTALEFMALFVERRHVFVYDRMVCQDQWIID